MFEVLSPAGSFECAKAAINSGCDAIYIGGAKFGARAYAISTGEPIFSIIDYAHLFNVKTYVTINTLFKETEFKELFSYVEKLMLHKVDGVLIQDIGVLSFLRDNFPTLRLHASTQMNISSVSGALLCKKLGLQRVVLARELSLKEIEKIKNEVDIELEVFVHGSMCYCYSGNCLMSSFIGERSGNRGRCAGPCRHEYKFCDKREYALSMKDMCNLKFIAELCNLGIDSFKIEGRMRSPVYVASVTSMYRKYVDNYILAKDKNNNYKIKVSQNEILEDEKLLQTIHYKGGFCTYLDKHNSKDMISINEKKKRAVSQNIITFYEDKYVKTNKKIPIKFEASFKIGSYSKIVASFRNFKLEVTGEKVTEALSSPLTLTQIEKSLRKTGESKFYVEDLQINMDDNIFMAVSQINNLRRDALDKLESEILNEYS